MQNALESSDFAASPGEASAMLSRFGAAYRVFVEPFLRGVRLEEHAAEQIRGAAARGPVVYVLLYPSSVDYLALNHVLLHRQLPLAEWASPMRTWWWRPVHEVWTALRERWRRSRHTAASDAQRLRSHILEHGGAAALFLQSPSKWAELTSGVSEHDALQTLLNAQQNSDRPIQLIPTMVVWHRAPDVQASLVENFFTGNVELPGPITELRNLFTRSHRAFVQCGQPVDLLEFCGRIEEPSRRRALHTLLRRYLHRESTLVRGPRLLPRRVMKRIVLDNPPMRELARSEAEATGKSSSRVLRQMDREYDRMAANFRWSIVKWFAAILQPLWTRIYSGVDIRPEDLERIRNAMRQGTAVLVPSHKSHFDYLLLSWVFYQHDIIVPHVVAGVNLAIWPVSILLRGSGAFFIKRSFSGDRIFPAVFARYLRELVRQNYPVEFFIEGGRTRSGKLMPPKLGVLGMVFEAAEWRRANQSVTLLPVAFAYEQVAEERAYARELGGEEKKAESVGQLVKARSVLRRRFGRVYLRVGEPIACDHHVDATADHTTWHQRPRAAQKQVLQYVGNQIIHRIGRVTLVLPTSLVALALVAHHRRGIRHSELLQRIERFRTFLHDAGADEAESMRHASQAIHEAVGRFLDAKLIEGLDHEGERVWSIAVDQRITLDFHKNQVLHFFATAGLATCALRALADGPFLAESLRPEFEFTLHLMRREFILDPNVSVDDHLESALVALERHGALHRADQEWAVADTSRVGEIYGLFCSLLESYAAFLESAPEHIGRGVREKDLPALVQSSLPGWVSRPEAGSLVTLQNACATFLETGVMSKNPEGRLVFEEAARVAVVDRIRRMVR
jgi:glycerol-3-phosphate O-acyltransferase